jgi:hypothetical protein
VTEVDQQDVLEHILTEERDYYVSDEGFLDFVRDSGAAPDAVFQPHGRYCQSMIEWSGEPDKDNPKLTNYKWKMTLWPRGSFKSAVFDTGMAAWEIAKDPNIRILVCSETGKQARKFVKKTMEIVDSDWFKERWGVHRGANWKLAQGEFTSALRTVVHEKEPTILAAGVGEVQTGSHWDLVIMDDICSQENTKNPESIESLWFWFGETLAQLDPGCRLFVIGTLHHFADIYCRIQKDPEMREMFDFSIHAWRDPPGDPNEDNGGELFFPGRLTPTFVSRQKAFMPPRLYACFYENVPTSAEDRIFKPEYFQVIEDSEIPQNVWTFILTDFAFIAEEKKKGKADRCAFWVVSVDVNRYAYVRDVWMGRWKASDSVRVVCQLWNDGCEAGWNMKGVSVEETTHNEILSSVFEEVRRQTFIHPKIIKIKGRSQEVKDMRIEASEPKWRRGEIYFAASFFAKKRRWNMMYREQTEWPFSEHDDGPDAQSDLDKKYTDGGVERFYLPSPPPGWRTSSAVRHLPSTVSGRFNPERAYPAEEMHRADHKGGAGQELWRHANDAQGSQNQSIFRRPPPRPTRPDGS